MKILDIDGAADFFGQGPVIDAVEIEKILYKKELKSLDIYIKFDKSSQDDLKSDALNSQDNLDVDSSLYKELKEKIKNFFKEEFSLPIKFHFKKIPEKKSFYTKPVTLSLRKSKASKGKKETQQKESDLNLGQFSKNDKGPLAISEISNYIGYVLIKAAIHDIRTVNTKSEWTIYRFDAEDESGGVINCKFFAQDKDKERAASLFKEGKYLLLKGKAEYDEYDQCSVFQVKAAKEVDEDISEDRAAEKRIELAIMSQMSNMEGLISLPALIKRLEAWGHEAFAVCDKDSLQAYPDMSLLSKKCNFKMIYGLRAKVLNNNLSILSNPYKIDISKIKDSFTVFDIETTGFSPHLEAIIEIGAVRYEKGKKVAGFSEFVNPHRSVPQRITELTSIDDRMLIGADDIKTVLPKFLEFAKDSILVAHNADFDMSFIRANAERLAIDLKPAWLDTLALARCLHPEYKNHKLDTLCKNLQIALFNHHRAVDDASATGELFLKLMDEWRALNIDFEKINESPSNYPEAGHKDWDLLIYCKKQSALKYLYEMTSKANLQGLFRSRPGIMEKVIRQRPEGLLAVGGFLGSRLFEAVAKNYPKPYLNELIKDMDALALEPPSFVPAAISKELVENEDHYKSIIKKLISLGQENNKPIFAIGSPSYLDEGDRKARNILINYQRNIDFDYNGRYRLKNTEEMLEEFAWLGHDLAKKLVVDGPKEFIKNFDDILPIPDGTFTPEIKNAAEDLRNFCYQKAREIYGEDLPDPVANRLERELDSIISNGYASLYIIARELVLKSEKDGYLVGSRGSVGSSFAAHMAGITEVNPLRPHYVCPKCKHSEFIDEKGIESGFDLPAKDCPICKNPYRKDGHTIPFEVFLGFDGDKEPDIDLNFAGQYMPVIHKYTEDFFGKGKVFRAGTISGIQTKTAYGFIKKYMERSYIDEKDRHINEAGIRSLQRRIVGTKRTSGQHAGGLMIVPKNKDISDFTPIQYPADDPNVGVITTHFSYKNLSGRLLKLDELGHTGPTIIKELQELSGLDPLKISFDDPETMALFNSGDSLGAKEDYSNKDDGSLGIPEFGTPFVRGMLKDTKPTSFGELCRISGLSHGTDVWLNNAQDLIRTGKTDLKSAICTRDDIMTYLISMDMDKLESFKTMESVRKGRGIPEGIIPHMKEKGVPDWYIESCQRIKYMFPKAHATAYVMLSYRIAWFKVHRPQAFYASYFSQHLAPFEAAYLADSLKEIQGIMQNMKNANENPDEGKWALLEIIEEMFARGYYFAKPDLYKSKALSFSINEEGKILPPLAALDDISEAVALTICKEREEGDFMSRSELRKRCRLPKAAYKSLLDMGLLNKMDESNQMSFLSGF